MESALAFHLVSHKIKSCTPICMVMRTCTHTYSVQTCHHDHVLFPTILVSSRTLLKKAERIRALIFAILGHMAHSRSNLTKFRGLFKCLDDFLKLFFCLSASFCIESAHREPTSLTVTFQGSVTS